MKIQNCKVDLPSVPGRTCLRQGKDLQLRKEQAVTTAHAHDEAQRATVDFGQVSREK
jgi:hypothetical protein